MDGYELRVLMYQEGWSGCHFIDTSQSGIIACRIQDHASEPDHFVGLYVEARLTAGGAWSEGVALYFNHDKTDRPRLVRAHAAHWLRMAGDGERLSDLLSQPNEEDMPPEGCVEVVPNLSEYDGSVTRQNSTFLYRREYTYAAINGLEIEAKSLVQALAYASFLSVPLASHQELLNLSRLPNSFSAEVVHGARRGLLDRIREPE